MKPETVKPLISVNIDRHVMQDQNKNKEKDSKVEYMQKTHKP